MTSTESLLTHLHIKASLFCLMLLAVFVLCQTSQAAYSGQIDETTKPAADTEAIQTLLAGLDAPSFEERESATKALIQLGPEILEPLSKHFFNASSEAGWRIHRILEGIGKNGNESDFLRSVAIIQLLFGTQDAQSQKRLAELQLQWKATQRSEAAKKLRSRGVEFQANRVASGIAAGELMRIEMMVRAAEVRDARGIRILTAADRLPEATPEPELPKWKDPRKKPQQTIAEIQQIITKDADKNRDVVKKLLPEELQVVLPPGSLDIPDGLLSDSETMKLIRELGSFSKLKLRNHKIDESVCKFISSQRTLNSIDFIDCTFADSLDALKLPRTVNSIEFSETIPAMESFPFNEQLSSLKLSNIELDKATATVLSKRRIQMIELETVKFDRESIQTLLNMRGLYRVTVSLCEFELEWFEKIRRVNNSLIVAAPKAFLGVQGPLDGVRVSEKTGCQISEVVPGTGAAEAGMQPLDVVVAVDGTDVVRFEDLRLLISQKRPGETMNVKVRRGDIELELPVKLGDLSSQ